MIREAPAAVLGAGHLGQGEAGRQADLRVGVVEQRRSATWPSRRRDSAAGP